MTTPHDPYEGQPAPEYGVTPEQQAPPPGQPQYYGQPAPHYYAPPAPNPPNPPSRVAWFAIGAASMFAIGLVGLVVLGLIISLVDGEFDDGNHETGYVYYVDQESVIDAVEVPCEDMLEAGAEVDVFDDPKKAASKIKAFALTAQAIADAIASANPNQDSKGWQADWETLSSDLTAYADNLSDAGAGALYSSIHPSGEMPVALRMSLSSGANCEVPSVIVALDPEVDEYNSEAYF